MKTVPHSTSGLLSRLSSAPGQDSGRSAGLGGRTYLSAAGGCRGHLVVSAAGGRQWAGVPAGQPQLTRHTVSYLGTKPFPMGRFSRLGPSGWQGVRPFRLSVRGGRPVRRLETRTALGRLCLPQAALGICLPGVAEGPSGAHLPAGGLSEALLPRVL